MLRRPQRLRLQKKKATLVESEIISEKNTKNFIEDDSRKQEAISDHSANNSAVKYHKNSRNSSLSRDKIKSQNSRERSKSGKVSDSQKSLGRISKKSSKFEKPDSTSFGKSRANNSLKSGYKRLGTSKEQKAQLIVGQRKFFSHAEVI
jgi:hypothetical protein